METQVGSPAVTAPGLTSNPLPETNSRWIVSPSFDLLFFANLLWLFAFVPGFVAPEGSAHIEFWQLYFLTVPHRWLTLVLVATDPERREGRNRLFVGLAVAALAVVAGAWYFTGAFWCLLLVDYLWNGWHFASQHAGILRIYARKSGFGRPWLERWGLRVFIFYVIARTAGWSTGWLEEVNYGTATLQFVDMIVLSLPVILLTLELVSFQKARLGKLIYLVSVCGLYASILIALGGSHRILIFALTAAGAAFHAIEYLALVTHYAWRRSAQAGEGPFLTMARHWLAFLAVFVVLLGSIYWFFEGLQWWLGVNLWAAFLHYTYDGLIWKLRRPATALALGADSAASPNLIPASVA